MKKPYNERTDLEKVQSQWNKIHGLHSQEQWSAAVVRAATATEIAANFAIRREFAEQSEFLPAFVNEMLMWANGISGKMQKLLTPLVAPDANKAQAINGLKARANEINSKRNRIAHQGEFCSLEEAQAAIEHARTFIHELVRLYEPEFELTERSGTKAKHKKPAGERKAPK
ncbi:hypothetical protein [Burkholderia diffusa]|uniref:hypothetical protein n=1 Tax=Burkholderia diffusa TaxID=488732 RepID=UPI001588C85E|nr:hypothetical protein [Burkholderia diffusa]